ncbi:hypothetical protein EDC01DRAFT_386704 [Geopyxis carbonaria]|nr:hypothetical protein EDC01DRAFT_386704 [Geopyxis carbonaria]
MEFGLEAVKMHKLAISVSHRGLLASPLQFTSHTQNHTHDRSLYPTTKRTPSPTVHIHNTTTTITATTTMPFFTLTARNPRPAPPPPPPPRLTPLATRLHQQTASLLSQYTPATHTPTLHLLLASMDLIFAHDPARFVPSLPTMNARSFDLAFWRVAGARSHHHLTLARAQLLEKLTRGLLTVEMVLDVVAAFEVVWAVAVYLHLGGMWEVVEPHVVRTGGLRVVGAWMRRGENEVRRLQQQEQQQLEEGSDGEGEVVAIGTAVTTEDEYDDEDIEEVMEIRVPTLEDELRDELRGSLHALAALEIGATEEEEEDDFPLRSANKEVMDVKEDVEVEVKENVEVKVTEAMKEAMKEPMEEPMQEVEEDEEDDGEEEFPMRHRGRSTFGSGSIFGSGSRKVR